MGSVEVTILGQQYKIKGDAPDEYIRELATYVDKKIRDVLEKSPNTAPLKATILAAISIADELFRYREDQERYKKEIEEKTEELVRLFE
jgi:cell division protein ZapA